MPYKNTFAIANGGIVNSMISSNAAIELSKLASPVYTKSEVDLQLNKKLSTDGGTVYGAINMSTKNIQNLGSPVNASDAATKQYVDNQVAGITVRSAKVYSDVTAAVAAGNTAFYSGNQGGNLSVALPEMPADATEFSMNVDVYVNGQLMRPGSNYDVVRDANLSQGLVFAFDLTVADVICVIVTGSVAGPK